MSDRHQQSFAHHRKVVPGFHLVTGSILLLTAVWSLYRVVTGFSMDRLIAALFAVAVILLFFYARLFATRNQDRIIRLEERLRLERVVPPELQGHVQDLTTGQLIALRFASDGELSDLVRWVVAEGVADPMAIKRRVTCWRPDHHQV